MGVLLKILFIVLVGCRSRETAFLWISDFALLDNVVFFERASGNAMHERAGAAVSDDSKAILVQEEKAADAIYLTVASS